MSKQKIATIQSRLRERFKSLNYHTGGFYKHEFFDGFNNLSYFIEAENGDISFKFVISDPETGILLEPESQYVICESKTIGKQKLHKIEKMKKCFNTFSINASGYSFVLQSNSLNYSELFIPLLNNAFLDVEFTDQESVARDFCKQDFGLPKTKDVHKKISEINQLISDVEDVYDEKIQKLEKQIEKLEQQKEDSVLKIEKQHDFKGLKEFIEKNSFFNNPDPYHMASSKACSYIIENRSNVNFFPILNCLHDLKHD